MEILAVVLVKSLSHVQLFVTPWTAARQASLSITNSWSLLRLMSIESVMPSNHLILCCPLPLLLSVFPSITVFSNELSIDIREILGKTLYLPIQVVGRIQFHMLIGQQSISS